VRILESNKNIEITDIERGFLCKVWRWSSNFNTTVKNRFCLEARWWGVKGGGGGWREKWPKHCMHMWIKKYMVRGMAVSDGGNVTSLLVKICYSVQLFMYVFYLCFYLVFKKTLLPQRRTWISRWLLSNSSHQLVCQYSGAELMTFSFLKR
jgi:hypothetical protein